MSTTTIETTPGTVTTRTDITITQTTTLTIITILNYTIIDPNTITINVVIKTNTYTLLSRSQMSPPLTANYCEDFRRSTYFRALKTRGLLFILKTKHLRNLEQQIAFCRARLLYTINQSPTPEAQDLDISTLLKSIPDSPALNIDIDPLHLSNLRADFQVIYKTLSALSNLHLVFSKVIVQSQDVPLQYYETMLPRLHQCSAEKLRQLLFEIVEHYSPLLDNQVKVWEEQIGKLCRLARELAEVGLEVDFAEDWVVLNSDMGWLVPDDEDDDEVAVEFEDDLDEEEDDDGITIEHQRDDEAWREIGDGVWIKRRACRAVDGFHWDRRRYL
ncbi:hypothetical protein QBC38DRAFT_494835 [Podospora fimiseda]|uniref:Uncharacterized protein n=1 Tax=Podospora fimiseda TaxID=252190 RepID=A0AAN7H5Y2_9PEZI|nr:hypothetical protein QBC38DRAFT_494835 [Podospora fimiseda]